MSTILQDLRFAGRVFAGNKSFTAVAILTLALGIGAGISIFSVVNGILLRPLPYPEGQRIQLVQRLDAEGNRSDQFRLEEFEEWQRRSQSFAALSAVGFVSHNLTGGKEPQQLRLGLVGEGFFRVMGIGPRLGRAFSDEDNASNRALAVLSHRLWQRQFAGQESVLGRSIDLDGASFTVVGVLPEEFQYPQWADLLVPLGDGSRRAGGAPTVRVVGRLAEGVRPQSAAQEMEALVLRLEGDPSAEDEPSKIRLVSLLEDKVGDTRPALLTLMGAVGFLLLIACTNVAGLLLARGAARQREMAVRLSLGASSARIWRQLLTESLCLSVAGGGAGLLLAAWGVSALKSFSNAPVPRMEEIQVNWTVAIFCLSVSLLVGLAFGLLPAWQATRRSSPLNLSHKGRSASDSGGGGLRRTLVAAQVAMALVLLVGAGLMLRSFQALQQVELGFSTSVLTAGLQLPRDKYPQGVQVSAFYRNAVERLQAHPEVASAAACNYLPLFGPSLEAGLSLIGEESAAQQQWKPRQRVVTPGFFEAMDIPILAGRGFEWSDDAQNPPVLMVNDIAARRFWPDGKPVGREVMARLLGDPVRMRVVGVVGTIRASGPRSPAEAEVYAPHAQHPWLYMNLIVRGRDADPAALGPVVRSVVHGLDRERPLFAMGTLQSVLDVFLMTEPRFLSFILTAFACSALLLALMGLYGLVSFAAQQRVPEIGTRMALGATGADILRSVVGQGAVLIVLGLGAGAAAAAGLTRYLSEQLFQIGPLDPATFAAAALLLLAVGLLACFFPARRASRIDPVQALRSE